MAGLVAEEREAYWDEFYARGAVSELSIPSQFAAFVANECRSASHVLDIACGSGRDAFFFARHFPNVVGVDRSATAIERCRKAAADNGIANARFVRISTDDRSLSSLTAEAGEKRLVVYARFFLHAITEQEQTSFFDLLSSSLRPGDFLALEYRTVRDASNMKSTPDHYRRFISPASVMIELSKREFDLGYAVEGFGLAKYKQDDAYVARSLHWKA
jgi:cyclopropane fatty-acyl-phospholipid synthase-like methyltransferase